MKLPHDIKDVLAKAECLHSKAAVDAALDRMAQAMEAKLADKNPIFICVVVGGIVPLGHLLTRLDFPLEVDYMHATRYRGKTTGSQLHWKAKNSCSLQNRVVVVVDDILDTGLTLKAIVADCYQQGAKQVYTAALVDKAEVRHADGHQQADFVGLAIGSRYVFGYGMDYKEYLRNAPGIYAVADEHV